MSKLSSTLFVDGVEMVEGSPEAVAMYVQLLREAVAKLDEARRLLALVPDVAEPTYRKQQDAVERKLSKLTGHASRFSDEFTRHDLDWATSEARFRKELP